MHTPESAPQSKPSRNQRRLDITLLAASLFSAAGAAAWYVQNQIPTVASAPGPVLSPEQEWNMLVASKATMSPGERMIRLEQLFDALFRRPDISLDLRLSIAEELLRNRIAGTEVPYFVYACQASSELPPAIRERAAAILSEVPALYAPYEHDKNEHINMTAELMPRLAKGTFTPPETTLVEFQRQKIREIFLQKY